MDKAQEESRKIEASEEVDELDSSSRPSCECGIAETTTDLEAIVAIAELLEVALHTILYIRQVYPIDFFDRRVKFGIPVFQCVERSIREYISEAVNTISEEIAEGHVARVIIAIHQSETPVEKFIFSFGSENDSDKSSDAEILPLEFIQRQARGMLLKLNAIDTALLPLETSEDLSFSVIMHLREGGAFRIGDEDVRFDVSREDESIKERSEPKQDSSHIKDPALIHIIRTGQMSVYLHVQELTAKGVGSSTKFPGTRSPAKPAEEGCEEGSNNSPEESSPSQRIP